MKKIIGRLFIILALAAAVCAGVFIYGVMDNDSGSADGMENGISGNGIEVDDTDSLNDSGITGEDYVYEPLEYSYYVFLDSTQRSVYAQICANAEALSDTFVPVVECSADDVMSAAFAAFLDHPEYFWLETSLTYKYTEDGRCVQVILDFNDLTEDFDRAKALFDESAGAIMDAAAALGSEYDREKYVHDAIIDLTSYDENADYNQSAYSALVTGATVCAGYARAFQYIMNELGIETYYCSGYSNGEHAWNIVGLDGGYYNVDLTWDDSEPISYIFFNCTDAYFASTHTRSEISENLPACTASTYSGLEDTGGPGAYPGTEVPGGGVDSEDTDPAGGISPDEEVFDDTITEDVSPDIDTPGTTVPDEPLPDMNIPDTGGSEEAVPGAGSDAGPAEGTVRKK